MKTKSSVVLFEDDEDERPTIVAALKKALPSTVPVVTFTGAGKEKKGTYESRILKDFGAEIAGADLIVCDQDLSLIGGYNGLSAQVITAIAHAEGIPIALYGRGPEDYMTQRLKERRPFLERRFVIHLDHVGWDAQKFARKTRIIYDGCQQIFQFLNSSLAVKKGKQPQGTPSSWMSKLLEKPYIINRLELYGSGDQQYLSSLIASAPSKFADKAMRVLGAELSYWLWDSILRFPGIVVNTVSARSMLNLSKATWELDSVQALFEPAAYHGPFGVDKKFWWRDDLQAIVEKEGVADGLALVQKKKIRNAERSQCSVDPSKPAGYYCMLSEEPVSFENSVGDIPYFPSGADLARISKKHFARVAPWAGLQMA